ncbi:MAG: hypothetical protein CVU77_06695 [Elusimicrobia bacterium HGW-Elusimicrobia-1]|nr:MAG: hypothetical protein CVU77_06695 [Elusimicrobia bacterium HGW-Elusimicrobia-1]
MKIPSHKVIIPLIAAALSLCVFQQRAFALIPADGRPRPGRFRDGVSRKPDPAKLRRMGYSAPEIRRAMGTEGTKKVAVIFVNFPSADGTTSSSIDGTRQIQDPAKIMTYISSMTHFYKEASYGKLNLVFTTYSAVTADYGMSYYSDDNAHLLIKEAIMASGANAATHDAVMIVHAGYGQESTGKSGDIFSAFYPSEYFPIPVNGFREGFVVPEFQKPLAWSPFGVYVHEMGHQLGLPDLYSTDKLTGGTRIGIWCLMDYGPWGGDGHKPSHLSAWCKNYLGWLEVSTAAAAGEYALNTVSSSSGILRIPIDVASDPDNEYFLVEYRRRDDAVAAYDKDLPASGILIWHINDTVGSVPVNDVNNYPVLRVALVPADSTLPSSNYGDVTDPWPGSKITFADPDSRAYSGAASGIAAANFRNYASSSVFSVDKIAVSPAFALSRLVNYPNPAGKNFFHPRGVLTTINFRTSRPARNINLAIYNITGEKILSVPSSAVSIRVGGSGIGASSDENWVYEFDWNGKDSGGADVAPGVYIYRLRADGQIKTGKMVVER